MSFHLTFDTSSGFLITLQIAFG